MLLLTWAALAAGSAQAQTPIIGTIAGGGRPGLTATAYSATNSSGVAVDENGNLYVAVTGANQIWVVSPGGAVTEIIGNGPGGFGAISPDPNAILPGAYNGDGGPATEAALNGPAGLALDSNGNLYIADALNHVIRKVTAATGIISTVAGNGKKGYSGDTGPAINARLNKPNGVAVDKAGNIYIADTLNNVIRKVSAATGIISTVAGNFALGNFSYTGDGGPATGAGLYIPGGVAVDASGNIYIADTNNAAIRKVTASTGLIATIAGGLPNLDYGFPGALTLNAFGDLFVAAGGRIFKLTAGTGAISTIAGTNSFGSSVDGGPAPAAVLNSVSALALDSSGDLYLADRGAGVVRKITATTGIISTVVGNGLGGLSGDGGPATSAQFSQPFDVTLDAGGNLYIADTHNEVIRKVAAKTGVVTSVAGHFDPTGAPGSGDGGPATMAHLNPTAIALDSQGSLYIADEVESAIRKVTAGTGVITTIAGGVITHYGGFPEGYSGDGGPATSAQLNIPRGVAVDSRGNVYIADSENSAIRKITAATGIITTVAGVAGPVYGGGGGPATAAELNKPAGIAVDLAGNLYIADRGNHAIRKVVAATGIITTVAGNGAGGYTGDGGLATRAQLNQPARVAMASNGDLYIADQGNNAIRKVTVATGIITTIAGNGVYGFGGDGASATSAELANPASVATGPDGRVYIADTYNNRIRAVPGPPSTAHPNVTPTFTAGLSVPAGGTTTLSFPIINAAADHPATAVSFNSALSSGLVVATPNRLDGSCGSVAAVEGGRRVTVSGVDLAPGATCTFSVDVTAVGLGVQYGTVTDLVSSGQAANWFRLADIGVNGSAAVSNSASLHEAKVTPNAILSYFGPVGCLSAPHILVNDTAAAILFSNATQINFVTPASLVGDSSAIQVVCDGTPAVTLTVPEAEVDPAIFTQTGTGTGQGSVVNVDGTINSSANPAASENYISVYGTGFGLLNPASPDGLRHLAAAVSATIAGKDAMVIYAGEAPGETAGLQQINVQVPQGLAPGPDVAIVLTANGVSTQASVTVAVK